MNRKYLVDTLELIKPALAKNDTVPVFQCFTFQDGFVTAYDDTIAIIGPTNCDLEFGVHGNTLLGLLSSSSAEEVDLSLDHKNDLVVKMGKSTSRLPYIPSSDFIFEEPTAKWQMLSITVSLIEALQLCLETVSSDETQLALHGITIEGDTMYSCNGDTITRIRLKNSIEKNRVLFPTAFCSAVVKFWGSLEMTKGQLQFTDEWVCANFDEWAVYGRVLEIKDPIDFDALIKRTMKGKAKTIQWPAELDEALSRARVLADPESERTDLTVAKNYIKLRTETSMGEVKDEFKITEHPDITTMINAAHVQKALKVCDQIAFLENCTVLEKAPAILIIVSNMG
jgi:DNA polymerase III sliding clamp (beta) subunit (PCNA family)